MAITLKRNLTILSDTAHLKEVRDFVGQVVRASEVGADLQNRLVLAIDEAVTNIIKHAYEEGRKDAVDLRIDVSPSRFEVVIHDRGKSFNPSALQDLEITAHVQAGRTNGLGVFLMRQIMDEVEYVFKEGIRNELRMVKYL